MISYSKRENDWSSGMISLSNHSEKSDIMEYKEISQMEELCGSSFFILDIEKLRRNFLDMNKAFKSRYENFLIGYSYKTNYLPAICKELSSLGAFAEVVSRLEYDLALRLGEAANRIIYNGPIKSREDIFFALKNKSIVNIDSMYEVDYVKEYADENRGEDVCIGIRVNFDMSENGESILQDGYAVSRFGICVENGDFTRVVTSLNEVPNIKIIGLHGHFSTKNRSVESYRRKTETLCHLAKQYIQKTLEFIDIGGGIYGELPPSFQVEVPSFDDYAEAVCSVMNREFPKDQKRPILILEPGVSMVANTMSFVTRLIEVKEVKNTTFVLVDGSVHNIKPTMHRINLPMRIVRNKKQEAVKKNFHIVGYTCMEKDYLAHDVFAELPDKGDYIIFENVGAYTIVFNPPFIKERPAIIAIDKGEVKVVRKKEKFEQFFNEEIYVF